MPSDFEKDFSDIAYSYIQAKNPEILKYIVGFEISDFDEKSNKGLGKFLLNVNGKYLFVPVFFINGELKPLIMAHDKTNDIVYPLDSDWLNFFKSKKIDNTGNGVDALPMSTYNNNFNFRNILQPTYATKYGKLKEFLKQSNLATKQQFLNWLSQSKPLASYCAIKYGSDILKVCKPTYSQAKPEMVMIDTIEKVSELDALSKLRFAKNGYEILDNRNNDKADPVYETDFRSFYTSPKTDGIYKVNTNQGQKDVLISINPFFIGEKRNMDKSLIAALDNGDYGITDLHQIILPDSESPYTAIENMKFKSVKRMQIGKLYSIYFDRQVHKVSCFSEPFEVLSKVRDKDGLYSFTVQGKYSCTQTIITLRSSNHQFTRMHQDLFVPEDAMVIELGNPTLIPFGQVDVDHYGVRVLDKYKYQAHLLMKNDKPVRTFHSEKEAVYNIAKDLNISVKNAQHFVQNEKEFFKTKPEFAKQANPSVFNNSMYSLQSVPERNYQEPVYDIKEIPSVMRPIIPMNMTNYSTVSQDIENLMALSQTMDGELFDEGMIGILAKSQNPGDIIKKFVPDLTKGMDKLGKIIMAIWYHGYNLKEDFGIDEFSEFEEQTINTFQNLGSLILKIHKKDFTRNI